MTEEGLRRRAREHAACDEGIVDADDISKARPRRGACYRCTCCLLLPLALMVLLPLALHGFSPARTWAAVNFAAMRFFRDLSRVKARKRRFGQKGALMLPTLLMGREEPLPLGDAAAGLALTPEELTEYDGRLLPDSADRAPLLLSVRGRIYDVSAGASFYGPGKTYHKLTGKDATRAFCTGCLEPECLIPSTAGLSEAQLKEADRWIEMYEHHDKYKLVGQLRLPSAAEAEGLADDDADGRERAAAEDAAWEEEQVARAKEVEGKKQYQPFRPV